MKSPARFGVWVGVSAGGATAGVAAVAAVILAYSLGGADAVAGHPSADPRGLWLSDSVRVAVNETMHAGMTVLINWGRFAAVAIGVLAGLIARNVRREQVEAAADRTLARRDALEAEVWRAVAEALSDNVDGRYRVDLVEATHRLLDERGAAESLPLFNGSATDRLPALSKLVRVNGPICSGKTVCSCRLVVQEMDAGRHVTVIRSGETSFGRAEYSFDDITSAHLRVVDAESLSTADARRALAERFDRRGDRKSSASRADETIVIDAGAALQLDEVRDLVAQLADTVSDPDNRTRLVVLVSGPDDLSDLAGRFDTEIVLPGKLGCRDPEAIENGLQRLSGDGVTVARLAARVRGGGVVTPHESQVLDILDRLCGDSREYAAQRMTRFIEDGMPITAGFQHGILKTPDGTLLEFTLPDKPSSGRSMREYLQEAREHRVGIRVGLSEPGRDDGTRPK